MQRTYFVAWPRILKIGQIDVLFTVTRSKMKRRVTYTTQNLLRITFSFNDLMLKTNRLKKDIFLYKDRLIFGLDDPVANMSIRHVYYA